MYLVVAEDQAAYDALTSDTSLNLKGRVVNAASSNYTSADDSKSFMFDTPGFVDLVRKRPFYIKVRKSSSININNIFSLLIRARCKFYTAPIQA